MLTSSKSSKIAMFLSALLMGNVGLFVSLLSNFSVFTIVLLRGIFGTSFLTILIIVKKSLTVQYLKEAFKYHWKYLIAIGIVNPLVILFYFLVILISGYAIAAFLLYTSGIFLIGLLIATKEEEVSKINIISFIVAILGVALIMEFWDQAKLNIGLIYGILSGISLALLTFFKKKIYNKRKSIRDKLKVKGDFDLFLAWWSTMFIIFLFFPLGFEGLLEITVFDTIVALLLGIFPTGLAFFLYNIGVKNDEGGDIVILSYFEPIMATINTAIFLQDLSIFTIIGGVLILCANIIILKFSKKKLKYRK